MIREVTKSASLELIWRALVAEKKLPASWNDSPLRRFVHFEARACAACSGLTQVPPCPRCNGTRNELVESERSHPASLEACGFFAASAERLTVVEDAARELVAASTQRLRWKTATEEPFGAQPLHRFDEVSVVIESVTNDALTLVAYGIACRCHDAEWQGRPTHVTRWIGVDDHHAEVTVSTCTGCGANWLEYFFEDHHDNGSRYRGLISTSVADQVTTQNAAEFIAQLPWYWLGGTYYFGKTSRSSGAVRWH